MEIAFLGMGIMGSAMAANCLKAGHAVTVYNRTISKTEPLRVLGAGVAATPAKAAVGKEAILICVEDTPDVEQVLFGPHGVAHALARPAPVEPALVIDHSTISPEAEARFAARLQSECGAQYLDAPVTGGDSGARAGTLAIMVGGPVAGFERARPLLAAMGQTLVHIGERHGDGQRAKLINQLLAAINCLATTEAMRFGEALGVDMNQVLAAISRGAAGSWSLSNLGPRWLRRDFTPGFRLRHLLKDLRYCHEILEGLPDAQPSQFPGLRLVLDLVQRAVQAGHGDDNIQAMGRIFETPSAFFPQADS